MKKLLMIVNPNAGKAKIKGKLTDILDTFIKAGYQLEVYITQESGEATEVARKRGCHVDRVVCSGGDGTLNETVNGLMKIAPEKRPELGYISAGTTNDFAHSLKLPSRMKDAAKVAANGIPFLIDIGSVNGKYFCYVSGFGAFTDISYITPQDMKKILGHQAYIVEAAKQLMNLKAYPVRIESGENVYEDNFLCGLVSNSYRVGGMTGIWGSDIEMDEGLFEVTLIRQPRNLAEWGELATALFITNAKSEFVIRFKTDHITFHSESPIDWVKDGEFGGSQTDVDIRVLHRALTIMKKEEKKEEKEEIAAKEGTKE
ncbi:MAG: YegS/Rv2252/BmrU family lipid kinase [Clostridiales bacterium]|nr:YegS/Rv2252/BmrU family lipid kinase [Clostridiales bacterium]